MRVVYEKSEGMKVPIKVWGDVEDSAIEQMKNVARLPFIHKWASLMPDSHFGYGVPIGSVVPTKGYVMPYAVGADIGCGMSAVQTNLHVDHLSTSDIIDLFKIIQEKVPVGRAVHQETDDKRFDVALNLFNRLRFDENTQSLENSFRGDMFTTMAQQIGTLGDGNHFLELQKDQDGMLWFMVHSGSRQFGAKICDHHMSVAKNMCEKYHSPLSDPMLAYLPVDSEEGQLYIDQMNMALDYAYQNRLFMINEAILAFFDVTGHYEPSDIINIHHNYASIENHFGQNVWVHRKGATAARGGQVGIIPGSMCTKSYIVTGKGDKDSFMSCSHGSGRNFSRKEAMRRIDGGIDASVEDQLGDVMAFGSNDIRDEVASAYKDITNVMKYQSDLVHIDVELTPIAVLKG